MSFLLLHVLTANFNSVPRCVSCFKQVYYPFLEAVFLDINKSGIYLTVQMTVWLIESSGNSSLTQNILTRTILNNIKKILSKKTFRINFITVCLKHSACQEVSSKFLLRWLMTWMITNGYGVILQIKQQTKVPDCLCLVREAWWKIEWPKAGGLATWRWLQGKQPVPGPVLMKDNTVFQVTPRFF